MRIKSQPGTDVGNGRSEWEKGSGHGRCPEVAPRLLELSVPEVVGGGADHASGIPSDSL